MNNFLLTAYENLIGVYYTPKYVIGKIKINIIYGNPPYEAQKKNLDRQGDKNS